MPKALSYLGGAVEYNLDVGVARSPGIAQQRRSKRFELRGDEIAQPIEGFAKRLTPFLIPAGLSGIATTIAAPALDSMHAAPGRVLYDLHFPRWRIALEKFAVIGDLDGLLRFNVGERIGQRHFAVLVMMAIRFAIGRDMS